MSNFYAAKIVSDPEPHTVVWSLGGGASATLTVSGSLKPAQLEMLRRFVLLYIEAENLNLDSEEDAS